MTLQDHEKNTLIQGGSFTKNYKKFHLKLSENERIIGLKYNAISSDHSRKKDIQFIIGKT